MSYEEKSPVAYSLTTTVLKQIPIGGRPLRGLGHSAGISALQRHGFVYLDGGYLFLTDRGTAVSEKCDGWIQQVEAEWRGEFSNESVNRLRHALEEVIASVHPG